MCKSICETRVYVRQEYICVESTEQLLLYCIYRQKKTFTAERVEQLKQLARTPDIYERLARALGTDINNCH